MFVCIYVWVCANECSSPGSQRWQTPWSRSYRWLWAKLYDAGNRIQVFARAIPWSQAGQVIETRGGDLAAQSRPLRACFRSDTWFPVPSVHCEWMSRPYPPASPQAQNQQCQRLKTPKQASPCRWSSHLYSRTLCSSKQICGQERLPELKSSNTVESCSLKSLSFPSVLWLTVAMTSLEPEYLFKDVYTVHTTRKTWASLQQRAGLFWIHLQWPSAHHKTLYGFPSVKNPLPQCTTAWRCHFVSSGWDSRNWYKCWHHSWSRMTH